jgi:lipid-A-disaccharide synthase
MQLYIVAGELSGDTHAAGLMRALHASSSSIEFKGLGGPAMQEAGGGGIDNWLEQAAVVGLSEVLANYRYFKQRFEACLSELAAKRPAAIILVDYPGLRRFVSVAFARRCCTTLARRSGLGRRGA